MLKCIGNAQAFVAVRPVIISFESEETVVPGNHQYLASFEPLIEFHRGDRQSGKPQPQEQRALAAMHEPIHVIAERLVRRRAGEAAFCLVKWPDDLVAQTQDLSGQMRQMGSVCKS